MVGPHNYSKPILTRPKQCYTRQGECEGRKMRGNCCCGCLVVFQTLVVSTSSSNSGFVSLQMGIQRLSWDFLSINCLVGVCVFGVAVITVSGATQSVRHWGLEAAWTWLCLLNTIPQDINSHNASSQNMDSKGNGNLLYLLCQISCLSITVDLKLIPAALN